MHIKSLQVFYKLTILIN